MLLNDSTDSNRIIEYDISFDSESTKTVLEILVESFEKRKIELPYEETFFLHNGFDLSDLKRSLEKESNVLRGNIRDLSVYHYAYGELRPKKNIIGDMYLVEEISVSRTEISCSFSSIISFILNHLREEECNSFISTLDPIEKVYIEKLLRFGGYERLTVLLGTIEDIREFLEKCQNFEVCTYLEDIRMLEKIHYFKMIYSLATLTANKFYDRSYLNSISHMGDEMERETIQNILDASTENAAMIKMLKLEPKRILK